MNILYKNLPESPGVYLMKNRAGEILYIGKAANLRRRVASYFLRSHDSRLEKLVSEIYKIDYLETDSVLEALILEAKLIKKHQPPYNIREKDDTSFLFIEITDEKFPRILLARGKNQSQGERFGPFVSAANLRQAMGIMRKIFPWSTHGPEKIGKLERPCFDYEIGLCPGTCVGIISRRDYLKNIRRLKLFLSGKKKKIIAELNKEMLSASKKLDFEKAHKIKQKIFLLEHIQDAVLLGQEEDKLENQRPSRIEGYDISNISGTAATGSMVVFLSGRRAPDEYRKFKIKTVFQANDTAMLKEVLRRRFQNNWPLPNLILIDGGKPQVNAASQVLSEAGINIPIIGIAKGSTRKKNEFIGSIPQNIDKKILLQVRDEAHRFALRYHRKLRNYLPSI